MSTKKICGDISEARGLFYFIDWKIDDYYETVKKLIPKRSCYIGEYTMESPRFSFHDATWHIELYPEGVIDRQIWSFMAMFVHREAPKRCKNVIYLTLGVKTNQGKVYCCNNFTEDFRMNTGGSVYSIRREEFDRDKDTILEEGAVTFFCIMRVVTKERVSSFTETPSFEDYRFLSRDLKKLLRSEKDADVTIKVQDQELRAHSVILSARSPVFAPMTKHDMKEKITGVIEIAEYDPETFREFLSFLYSGKPEKISTENVIDLYCAADQYCVQQLKSGCTDFILDELSDDNFVDILSLAVQYEDKELKGCLIDFFVKNVIRIVGTPKWSSFAKDYPKQSSEIMDIIGKDLIPQ